MGRGSPAGLQPRALHSRASCAEGDGGQTDRRRGTSAETNARGHNVPLRSFRPEQDRRLLLFLHRCSSQTCNPRETGQGGVVKKDVDD